MMKTLFFFLFFGPFVIHAQATSGVKFLNGFSWQQIREQAQRENKYIFIDVMASWCGPCKMMDKEVYPNDSVALFMNERFISVKVQMDSTKVDDNQVKNWYADARMIDHEYHIQGYPSFLFFNSAGNLVYRNLGFQDVQAFLRNAANALNPVNLTYRTKLQKYMTGIKDYESMTGLAVYVRDIDGDDSLAKQIARDYFENYLSGLSVNQVCTKASLDFISMFDLGNSSEIVFHLCYTESQMIDKAIGMNGWAKNYVRSRIIREELENKLLKDGKALYKNPDWENLTSDIKKKYSLINAESLVESYQVIYYRSIQDWGNWFYYKNRCIERGSINRLGNLVGFDLNDAGGWDAFLHCNDKKVLRGVIPWVTLAIKNDTPLDGPISGYLDTKANLFYKIGQKDSALYFEKMAIIWCQEYGKSHNNEAVLELIKGYQTTLDEMGKGEPTYLDQGALWDKSTVPKRLIIHS